jgi:signal transduction histidine kinase
MRLRRPTRRLGERLREDGTLAAVAVLAGLVEVAVNGWWHVGNLVLLAVPAAFAMWHRAPAAAATLVAAGLCLARLSDAPAYTQYVPFAGTLLIAYACGSRTADRRRSYAAAVALTIAPFVNLIGTKSTGWEDAPFWLLLGFAPWLAGRTVRRRRLVRNQLELRAIELEWEREELARLAVAEERSRIARDLHDVVAHSLTAMVVQAGAARRIVEREGGREQSQVAQALRAVADTGSASLDELDRLLGVIDGAAGPAPGLGAVERLVQDARRAGLDARLTVTGRPTELDPDVDLSAYRIVQEALTNVVKHAASARTDVHIDRRGTFVDIVIEDDGGQGASDPTSGDGSGHGLRGIRERAELYGGSAQAGPLRRGWRVEARLPARVAEPAGA